MLKKLSILNSCIFVLPLSSISIIQLLNSSITPVSHHLLETPSLTLKMHQPPAFIHLPKTNDMQSHKPIWMCNTRWWWTYASRRISRACSLWRFDSGLGDQQKRLQLQCWKGIYDFVGKLVTETDELVCSVSDFRWMWYSIYEFSGQWF